jgi:hypothetical protein
VRAVDVEMSQMVQVVSIDEVTTDEGENAFHENEVSGGSFVAADLDCEDVTDQRQLNTQ